MLRAFSAAFSSSMLLRTTDPSSQPAANAAAWKEDSLIMTV